MSKFTFAHLIGRKAKTTEEDDNAHKEKRDEDATDDEECNDTENDENAESDDEDDEDGEDKDNKDVKKGRHAERKRCARIFGSKAAATCPDIAAHLAFNTNLSPTMAISTLKAMGNTLIPQNNRRSLDDRMREEEQVRLRQDAVVTSKDSTTLIIQKMTSLYNSNKGGK